MPPKGALIGLLSMLSACGTSKFCKAYEESVTWEVVAPTSFEARRIDGTMVVPADGAAMVLRDDRTETSFFFDTYMEGSAIKDVFIVAQGRAMLRLRRPEGNGEHTLESFGAEIRFCERGQFWRNPSDFDDEWRRGPCFSQDEDGPPGSWAATILPLTGTLTIRPPLEVDRDNPGNYAYDITIAGHAVDRPDVTVDLRVLAFGVHHSDCRSEGKGR